MSDTNAQKAAATTAPPPASASANVDDVDDLDDLDGECVPGLHAKVDIH